MCYDHSTRLLDSLANERKTGVRWHQHNTSAGCIAPRRRLATNYTRGVKHAGKQASKHPIRAMKPACQRQAIIAETSSIDDETRGVITLTKLLVTWGDEEARGWQCNPGPGVV